MRHHERRSVMKGFLAVALACVILACSGAVAVAGEGKKPMVLMSTSMGDIKIELDPEKAPVTVENFLTYVKDGHYDGTIFHRVIKNFMIQGGGMDKDMNEKKTRAPIRNEAGNGLKNDEGTIAMARTNVVDSATAQFFINVNNNEFLNHKGTSPRDFGYAVFGKVVQGMDVVHKIENVATTSRKGHGDVPTEPVVIQSVKVVDK
jgi:cyclophilin family peptidyl-prolyl cis-trans isomerase